MGLSAASSPSQKHSPAERGWNRLTGGPQVPSSGQLMPLQFLQGKAQGTSLGARSLKHPEQKWFALYIPLVKMKSFIGLQAC